MRISVIAYHQSRRVPPTGYRVIFPRLLLIFDLVNTPIFRWRPPVAASDSWRPLADVDGRCLTWCASGRQDKMRIPAITAGFHRTAASPLTSDFHWGPPYNSRGSQSGRFWTIQRRFSVRFRFDSEVRIDAESTSPESKENRCFVLFLLRRNNHRIGPESTRESINLMVSEARIAPRIDAESNPESVATTEDVSASHGAPPANGSQPDLVIVEEDANGTTHQTRAFNSWLTGFESQLRQMSDVNYHFFIPVLMMIYGEQVEN
ncbi:hypothetical protein DFH07DRAFT_785053 [Mycena maculata]|uniref:Uncharacterized protein n=1 Tax=Mycena maculata TaxID=230809 RepID=A0AAD7MI29_9AGAR|nr:hypothetical protein DFH07DRAFT_785053 [Mycena maculata]